VPILVVTVEMTPGAVPQLPTRLTAQDLLGSDASGNAVRRCPPLPCVDTRWFEDAAVICAERLCDFNRDGTADVRDLVLMVRCVMAEGPCPDSTQGLDCVPDGSFTLADVLCCARQVLRNLSCPSCPVDSLRAEPSVRLRIDGPQTDENEIVLPLTLSGASKLGAARLDLAYPADRFTVVGVELAEGQEGWITLHEVSGARLTLGLIGAGASSLRETTDEVEVRVRLALRPGQSIDGILEVTDSQFSGPDGTLLAVSLGQTSRTLGGTPRFILFENRPEPFSIETRFELALDRGAEASIGVYDIAGRRLVSLHHGWLAAGPHEFRWDGRTEDGTSARNGVYFYRAEVGGRAVSRKMVLVRGD
jgi:hypothetical protein